jgi:hypothetical protein
MDKVKLNRLKRRIAKMRLHPANIKSQDLIRLSGALGREKSKRGKEPTYVSLLLPDNKPISIPNVGFVQSEHKVVKTSKMCIF